MALPEKWDLGEGDRRRGFSEGSFHAWRSKFGGIDVSDAKRLGALESENGRLKKLLAESMLEIEVTREDFRKTNYTFYLTDLTMLCM